MNYIDTKIGEKNAACEAGRAQTMPLTPAQLTKLVEKMLKALYVNEKKEHAPPIHNLNRLANLAGIPLDEDKTGELILISSSNIEARYPDLKRAFISRCTRQFTEVQLQAIREIYEWLRGMLS
jgi:HEPN domain-containing protein